MNNIENLENRVHELGNVIAGLQKENEMQARVYVKFEETIDKLQDLTESMHRLISIHDERIRVTAQVVDSIKAEMNNEIKELEAKMQKISSKLE